MLYCIVLLSIERVVSSCTFCLTVAPTEVHTKPAHATSTKVSAKTMCQTVASGLLTTKLGEVRQSSKWQRPSPESQTAVTTLAVVVNSSSYWPHNAPAESEKSWICQICH